MDLRRAVRIWRTRWILTSVLLILAMAGATGAAAKMPRYYQSASSVVLLASPAASSQNDGNPFLSFSPSLTLTADAVSREVMAPGTVRQLAARGFSAPYTVALPAYTTSTTGSVLLTTVTGTHAAAVQRTLQAVTAQISTQLAQLQHGIPARSRVRAETLSVTPQATLSISETARPLVIVGALLLVICLGAPIVVDGLITRRRVRIARRSRTNRRALRTKRSVIPGPSGRSPATEGELAFTAGATGSADRQASYDPAPGEPRLPSSSWPYARNGGDPARQASGSTGRRAGPGDVSRS
jgi:hypothetical protein